MTKFFFFEDFQIGREGKAERPIRSRTVTEADIARFAWITADYYPMHLDRHFAAKSLYGLRVAHGLLGTSLVTGFLSLNSPHIIGRGVPGAYLYGIEANYRDAIRVGDTVSLNWRITEKTDDPNHEGYGQVKTEYWLLNQDGKIVYDGAVFTLVRKKPASGAELKLKPARPWVFAQALDPEMDRTYYVEDFPVGAGKDTEGRTLTETDIVNFAGLTGDWNPVHTDSEFAGKFMFGERIAHGLLPYVMCQGAWVREHHRIKLPESAIAGRLRDKVTFLAPVKIGDTIRCHYRIGGTRISRSKPEMGIVTIESQVVNQRDEVIQEGYAMEAVASKITAGNS